MTAVEGDTLSSRGTARPLSELKLTHEILFKTASVSDLVLERLVGAEERPDRLIAWRKRWPYREASRRGHNVLRLQRFIMRGGPASERVRRRVGR
jgi:hypothetical protein